jgi:septal ring factor EnvC (AmiA/AmiB activator)
MMRCVLSLGLVCLATGVLPAAESDSNPLTQTRSTLEQWVQTKQLVSKTRSDWEADKESLAQTIALYERELQSVAEQMSKVSTNNTQVAREMAEATALQTASHETLGQTRQFATEFEVKVKQLVPRLPAPLQDILKPQLAKLPADPATSKLLAAERLQTLVAILSEVDKFNNAVNLFNEKRKNPNGDEVAVQTVYIGLGAGYFVNEAGDFAGVGGPGAAGWDWTTQSGIAAKVQEVVKIYRMERTAKFVTLPATVR